MTNALVLAFLAILLASACGSHSALPHDSAVAVTAGMDGGAGGQSGAEGAAAGSGGADAAVGGAAGGIAATIAGCYFVDSAPPDNGAPCTVTCGNGAIDSCPFTLPCSAPPGHVCPMDTFTETCDGSALGSATCASLGYAGGALRCASWCGFDTTGCDPCVHGAGVSGCASAVPEAVEATSLSLATTDTEIGVVWIDGQSQMSRSGVRFARFQADLSRLSLSDCLGPDQPTQVAVGATPSGWVVAATTYDGLHVFPLSSTGAPSGPDRVIPAGQDPLFVSRPKGGPLLYWTEPAATKVELVGADGSELTNPVQVFDSEIDTSAGVFTGDGFLLASRLSQIVTTRITTEGMIANQQTIASSKPDGYAPTITWNGTSGAISYYMGDSSQTDNGSLAWLSIDHTGSPMGLGTVTGPSALLGTSVSASGAPIASLGAQSIVLFGPTQFDLWALKVDGSGAAVGEPFQVTHDPALTLSYALGKRGTEVVAAWLTGGSIQSTNSVEGRIGLARFAP